MATPLSGQTALVTGGSKGYGVGIAGALKAAGASVWITGRDPVALEKIAAATRASGRLDILVNNAGGGIKIAATEDQTDESIAAAIALNLTGVIYGARRAARIMRQQRSGTIVNISSVAGHHAWPTWGVYGAAKAGLNHFAKSLYLELRPHGVRVMTVTPSWGATDFTDAAGLGPRDAATLSQCIKPAELGRIVADHCALPAHLCVQETILWPMVQEVSPL